MFNQEKHLEDIDNFLKELEAKEIINIFGPDNEFLIVRDYINGPLE